MTRHAASNTMVRDSNEIAVVSLVGATFARRLKSADFSGEVLFVGSKGAYIDVHGANLLGLGRYDQPAHPRMVLSELDLSLLQPGMPVRVSGARMFIGDSITLDMARALVWEPETVSSEQAQAPIAVWATYKEVLNIASVLHDGDNLGLALPMIQAAASGDRIPSPQASGSLFLDDALGNISGIVSQCLWGDLDGALCAAIPLIGAGPGLTPSGDDFIGGMLFAAHHLNVAYPSAELWNSASVEGLISSAKGRTGPISLGSLQDMAMGQSYAPLHSLIRKLLTGENRSDSVATIAAITKIGNTSGWDMLAGLLSGMLLVANKN